jgi:phosphocarrier protein
LHTRPATEIVKRASSFNADIRLAYQKLEVNAKSILGVLMLAASKGARIAVTAFGKDAEEAVASLIELAGNQFNIKY